MKFLLDYNNRKLFRDNNYTNKIKKNFKLVENYVGHIICNVYYIIIHHYRVKINYL